MIIKAIKDDLNRVLSIYGEVFDDATCMRFSNWERGEYPKDEIAVNAIARGNLFLYFEDDVLTGSVILDGNQPDDYHKIKWLYSSDDKDILVVHTLCIRPCFAGKGAGGRLLFDIEAYAKQIGIKVIRFDTYCDNVPARKMYLKAGFREAGMTDIFVYGQSRVLRCFEKKINDGI